MDIYDSRVTFATENMCATYNLQFCLQIVLLFLSSTIQLASLYKAAYRGKVEFGKSSQFVDF